MPLPAKPPGPSSPAPALAVAETRPPDVKTAEPGQEPVRRAAPGPDLFPGGNAATEAMLNGAGAPVLPAQLVAGQSVVGNAAVASLALGSVPPKTSPVAPATDRRRRSPGASPSLSREGGAAMPSWWSEWRRRLAPQPPAPARVPKTQGVATPITVPVPPVPSPILPKPVAPPAAPKPVAPAAAAHRPDAAASPVSREAPVAERVLPQPPDTAPPRLASKKLAAAAKQIQRAATARKAMIGAATRKEQGKVGAEASRRAVAIQRAGSAKVAALLAMIGRRRSAITAAFAQARTQVKAKASAQRQVARSAGATALADLGKLIDDRKQAAKDGAGKEATALEATGRTEADRARSETATTLTAIDNAASAAVGRAGSNSDVRSAVQQAVDQAKADAVGKAQQQRDDVAGKAGKDAKDAAQKIREGGAKLADEIGGHTTDIEKSITDSTNATVQRITTVEQTNLRQLDTLRRQSLAGLDRLKARIAPPIRSATRKAAAQARRTGRQVSGSVRRAGNAQSRAIDQTVRQAHRTMAALPKRADIDDAKLKHAVSMISATFTRIHRDGSAAVSAATRKVTTQLGRMHQGLTSQLNGVAARVTSQVSRVVSSAHRSTSQSVTTVGEETKKALDDLRQAHQKSLGDFGKQLQDKINGGNERWISQRTEHEKTIHADVDHGLQGVIDMRRQIGPHLNEIADKAKAEEEKPAWKKVLSGIWEGIKSFVGGLLLFIAAVLIVALIVLLFVSGIGEALLIAAEIVGAIFLVVGFVMALVNRWGELMERLKSGNYPWYAAFGLGALTVLAAAGDVFGVTPVIEGIVGHDAVSWKPLSAEERAKRTTVGVLTLITLGLARRANLGGRRGGGKDLLPGRKGAPKEEPVPGDKDTPPREPTPGDKDTPPREPTPGDKDTPPREPTPGDKETSPGRPGPGDRETTPEKPTPGDKETPPEKPTPGDKETPPQEPAPARGEQLSPANRTKLDDYLNDHLTDPAERAGVNDTVRAVEENPRISGLNDWAEFSTKASRPGISQGGIRNTLLDDVNELKVALRTAETDPNAHVRVGQDAHAGTRPGTTDQKLPSFDIVVERGGKPTNVEVKTNSADRLKIGDFGDAINHAADKIVDDPNVPAADRTTGSVEAALVATWPEPPRSAGGGRTITVDADGNVVLRMPNGREIGQGNLFAEFLDILNGNSRAAPPAGARKVDALTVYDRAGMIVKRFVKDLGGVWRIVP
jgi:hypothetical protein